MNQNHNFHSLNDYLLSGFNHQNPFLISSSYSLIKQEVDSENGNSQTSEAIGFSDHHTSFEESRDTCDSWSNDYDGSSNQSDSKHSKSQTKGPLTTKKRRRLSKNQQKQLLSQNGKKFVLFGNRLVEKDTEEYKILRERSKKAVDLFRSKTKEKQGEKEAKMIELANENKNLNESITSLHKELILLKDLLIIKSADGKLPNHLHELFHKLNLI